VGKFEEEADAEIEGMGVTVAPPDPVITEVGVKKPEGEIKEVPEPRALCVFTPEPVGSIEGDIPALPVNTGVPDSVCRPLLFPLGESSEERVSVATSVEAGEFEEEDVGGRMLPVVVKEGSWDSVGRVVKDIPGVPVAAMPVRVVNEVAVERAAIDALGVPDMVPPPTVALPVNTPEASPETVGEAVMVGGCTVGVGVSEKTGVEVAQGEGVPVPPKGDTLPEALSERAAEEEGEDTNVAAELRVGAIPLGEIKDEREEVGDAVDTGDSVETTEEVMVPEIMGEAESVEEGVPSALLDTVRDPVEVVTPESTEDGL